MKRTLLALCGGLMILGSCKEVAPGINFHGDAFVDTTYVLAAVPPADPHNVLVEEFTGATCTNCPAAHKVLDQIETQNPGRVNVIGLYIFGPTQTNPPHDALYDLRDSASTNISNSVYGGVNILPSAGIERSPVNGSMVVQKNDWSSAISSRLSIADSLNLEIISVYDTALNTARITAKVTYVKPVSYPHNISVVIVEDDIVDKQEYPFGDPEFPTGLDPAYNFTNVLRDVLSAVPFGDPVFASIPQKEAGRVCELKYTYQPMAPKAKANKVLVPAHCRVIAFVTDNVNYRVLQSVQTKLQ